MTPPTRADDPRPTLSRRAWLVVVGGWLLVLVPLVAFAALAEDVAEHEVFPFDHPVMMWVHAHGTTALTTAFQAVTQLGGPVAIPVASTVVAAALWWRDRRRDAALLAIAVIGSTLLNVTLKLIFRRSRPDFWDHFVVENGYSFPSGHAMASAALALAVVAVLPPGRRRRVVAVLGVAYVVAVGVSRIYLGVHYPSDVLAGWCVSAAWVALVWWTLGRPAPPPAQRRTEPGGRTTP